MTYVKKSPSDLVVNKSDQELREYNERKKKALLHNELVNRVMMLEKRIEELNRMIEILNDKYMKE